MLPAPGRRLASGTRRRRAAAPALLQAAGGFHPICFETVTDTAPRALQPLILPTTLVLLIQNTFLSRTPNINCE